MFIIELGVEKVITPVRRSLRFHGKSGGPLIHLEAKGLIWSLLDDEDYVSKNATKSAVALSADDIVSSDNPTSSKVKQLLEDHEFAFVPNEVGDSCLKQTFFNYSILEC